MRLCTKNENKIIEDIKLLLKDEKLRNEIISNQKKIINENSAKDLVEFLIKKYNK